MSSGGSKGRSELNRRQIVKRIGRPLLVEEYESEMGHGCDGV